LPQKTGERAGSPAASGVQPRARSIGAAGLHAVFGGAIGVGLSKPEGDAGCAGDRADEGAGGAISALWLSAHWHLSWTGRIRDEPRASLSAVAGCRTASAAQAAEEARGCEPAAATGADRAEPGVVLRLRVRPLQLKCLTVTDEFTKEGLAIDVDGRIRSPRVIEMLSRLVSERGAPVLLRSDNVLRREMWRSEGQQVSLH
jgi:hypothetical protein